MPKAQHMLSSYSMKPVACEIMPFAKSAKHFKPKFNERDPRSLNKWKGEQVLTRQPDEFIKIPKNLTVE